MQRLVKVIDAVSEAVGNAAMWLTLVLVLLVGGDVALRYAFNQSYTVVRELEWHVYSLIFLLGAAFTLRHNAHVRVDVFYQKLSKRGQALIDVLGALFFLLPGCWLVIGTSLPFAETSFSIAEGSPDPGGLGYFWPLKAAIPLSFALVALQGVAFLIKNLMTLLGKAEG